MTQETEALVEKLKAEHQRFAEKNKLAARGLEPEDKAELRAETTGHNIMMTDAIRIIREHALATPSPSTDTLERREAIADIIAANVSGPDLRALGIDPALHREDQLRAADAILALSLPAREVSGERDRLARLCESIADAFPGLTTRRGNHDQVYTAVACAEAIRGNLDGFDAAAKHMGHNTKEDWVHFGKVRSAIAALATTPAPREKLEADLAEAVKALKPFADAGECMDLETDGFMPGDKLHVAYEDHVIFDDLKFGDFEFARATLNRLSGEG